VATRPEPRKIVVIEANEVPLRLFEYFAERRPGSAIARLVQRALRMETEADDVPAAVLYPAQTWASLNTGVPYDRHRIHWYNSEKPEAYPFYWKLIGDQGWSVGLVNSLHTSPFEKYAASPAVRFLVPDCFATDARTRPRRFEPFQRLNLKHTRANRRIAGSPLGWGGDEMAFALSLPRLGVRGPTLRSIAALLVKILRGKVNRERVRNIQFLLLRDIFWKCLRSYDVDLAMFFTNHVAAMMHRYWYALFPEDYDRPLYHRGWIDRYQDEIVYALEILDDFLGELIDYCERTGRVLIVMTSMGQAANRDLREPPTHQVIVRSPEVLLERLGIDPDSCGILSEMEPEYTLRFDHAEAAQGALVKLAAFQSPKVRIQGEVRGSVVTLALDADPRSDWVEVNGAPCHLEKLGLARVPIDDAHSGRHHPRGCLFIYGSDSATKRESVVSYLEVAPALCEHFRVPRRSYMRVPTFRV
jgi:hypothetical protein